MEIEKEAIVRRLRHRDFYEVTVVDTVGSTNAVVKEWGTEGKTEGAVLIARSQTEGRGRLSRRFYSPKGSGIYFSILLRPDLPADKALLITTAAAVAVAEAIGAEAKIKWVNDVFVNNRKVCGILTESAYQEERLSFAVLGIGLNLTVPASGFPDALQGIAGSIFEHARSDDAAALVAEILDRLYDLYQNLESPAIRKAYEQRNLLKGKTVTAGKITGTVQGIDEAFRLVLLDDTGRRHTLSAGEVSIGSKMFDE